MVSVGSYRFMLDDMQQLANGLDEGGATVAALPDVFGGHRLVGTAGNVQGLQRMLAEQGINPLISSAFGESRRVSVS
jgi:hypothetical protein